MFEGVGKNRPHFWPMFFTILYFCFLGGLAIHPKTEFFQLNPNEMGDTFAGFVGPVALIWIVFGYFQQNNAIKIQAKELKAAVNQHQAQVTATSALVEQELRRARIDYYRLVAEAAGRIQSCKLLLHGDQETENTKKQFSTKMLSASSPFGQYFSDILEGHQREMRAMLKHMTSGIGISKNYQKEIETREILASDLDAITEKQMKLEKEIEDYSKIDFDALERNFANIVAHIGTVQALYGRIEVFVQIEDAEKEEKVPSHEKAIHVREEGTD
jgi:hypothetical protein